MCRPDEFSVVVDVAPDLTTVVRPIGELDLATAPKLRDALRAITSDDFVIDLSGLSFIDSSGLSVLVGAHKRVTASGHQMTVRAPSRQAKAVLEITGLDTVLAIEPATDSASEIAQ